MPISTNYFEKNEKIILLTLLEHHINRVELKNRIVIAIIVIAFFAGTLGSSLFKVQATTIDPFTSLIGSINELVTTVSNNHTDVNLVVAASTTGNFTLNGSPQVLYYGKTLCGINNKNFPVSYDTVTIQFANSTLVKNKAPFCTGFKNGGNIMLKNNVDYTFHNGNQLILNRSPNSDPFFNPTLIEVTRVIP